MIKLGNTQKLKIIQMERFGAYLGEASDKVLLPIKQLPKNARIGDELEVFIYRDSEDRLIATTSEPLIKLGEIAILKVKQLTKIGAFLDWGLEKDLLLPYAEMKGKVEEGMFYPVALYEDKSLRLAATMWTDRYIDKSDVDERNKEKALIRMKTDAENVYVIIEKKGGVLDHDDKADPKLIEKNFGLSKNAFKKAVGILYKAGRIDISEGRIKII